MQYTQCIVTNSGWLAREKHCTMIQILYRGYSVLKDGRRGRAGERQAGGARGRQARGRAAGARRAWQAGARGTARCGRTA